MFLKPTQARLPVNRNPMLDYPETQFEDLERMRGQLMENARRTLEAYNRRPQPEFTYSFNDPEAKVEGGGPPPFAYRPNDPRYYEEDQDKGSLDFNWVFPGIKINVSLQPYYEFNQLNPMKGWGLTKPLDWNEWLCRWL